MDLFKMIIGKHVLRVVGEQLKVLYSVIKFVSIFVVHNFCPKKVTAKMFLLKLSLFWIIQSGGTIYKRNEVQNRIIH